MLFLACFSQNSKLKNTFSTLAAATGSTTALILKAYMNV